MPSDSEPPLRQPWRQHRRLRPIPAVLLFLVLLISASTALGSDFAGMVVAPAGWIALVSLVGFLGSAIFSVLDLALFALDAEEIDGLVRTNPPDGTLLRELRRDLTRTWLALLTGGILFNLMFALGVGGQVLGVIGGPIALRIAAAVVVASGAVLFFGEILPGLLAARWLKILAPFSARCSRVASIVLYPLYAIPLILLRAIALLGGVDTTERSLALEAEKRLLALVGIGQVDVTLEEEEREMIDHAIEFGENTAEHFMTPRGEIEAVETTSAQDDVLQRVRRTTYSRLLVYNHSLDNVEGVLHSKQVLLHPEVDYHRFVSPALFVPDSMPLLELLALMKSEHRQIVVVLDEYGGTAGIVTMNDLLVELVGGNPDEPETTSPQPTERSAS